MTNNLINIFNKNDNHLCYIDDIKDLLLYDSIKTSLFVPITKNTKSLTLKPFYSTDSLLCHDFKGGFINNGLLESENGARKINRSESFAFWHWKSIDYFVYFSHHSITIPPSGFIDAAHFNSVPILGTIIFEWKEGAAQLNSFINDKNLVNKFVKLLGFFVDKYNFDGYLLNIECNVTNTKNILNFISDLRKELKALSLKNIVIWYDSLSISGKRKYSYTVNSSNSDFLFESDFMFLDYSWREKHLRKAEQWLKDNIYLDKKVFASIDVFDRSWPNRGGFYTSKTISKIKKFGLSTAIFAPGWILERKNGEKNFFNTQNKFWNSISRSLHPNGKNSSDNSNLDLKLNFFTCFNAGIGEKYYYKGIILYDNSWYNLSLSSIQPFLSDYDGFSISLYFDKAFIGGSCLRIERNFNFNKTKSVNLFSFPSNNNVNDYISSLEYSLYWPFDELFPFNFSIITKNKTINLNSKSNINFTVERINDWKVLVFDIKEFKISNINSFSLNININDTKHDILIGHLRIITINNLQANKPNPPHNVELMNNKLYWNHEYLDTYNSTEYNALYGTYGYFEIFLDNDIPLITAGKSITIPKKTKSIKLIANIDGIRSDISNIILTN